MSILSNNSSSKGAPSFHEFKKQASFFFKEKIKTARLVLTDVTPAQLLTEEATDGKPWAPDTRTLGSISKAAFELDDYTRIVEILHKRLLKFERKNWRVAYNSLTVVEHLLTRGPASVAAEFEVDKGVIEQMGGFQYIDEKGFNWGLALRKRSGKILKLLEKGPLLKEERDRARKLTRGIQGFGSFCQRSSDSATQGILRESSFHTYGRSNSESLFINHESLENQFSSSNVVEDFTKKVEEPKQSNQSNVIIEAEVAKKPETQTSFTENVVPNKEEFNPLLGGRKDESTVEISAVDEHPFSDSNNQSAASLL